MDVDAGLADGGRVQARFLREGHRLAAAEGQAEEVLLRRVGAGAVGDLPGVRIDVDDTEEPRARRDEDLLEGTESVAEFELRSFFPLPMPEEQAVPDEVRSVVVEVQPGGVGLLQERRRLARRGVRPEEE